MYSYVDKAQDGNIYGVYTGYAQPAQAVSFLNPINAEHTVPQSWFSKRNPMKSDIHHLFPTHKTPNNKRGSHPFGETAKPTLWLGMKNGAYTETKNRPQENEASYSEFVVNTMFEPPESHKGNVARAVAYFYTMYPNEAGDIKKVFYQGNVDLLAEWHNSDPVDAAEIERNKRIKEVQGNGNPYIEDAGLICRAWELTSCR